MPFLSVEGLTVAYGQAEVLHGVSLAIEAGSVVTVMRQQAARAGIGASLSAAAAKARMGNQKKAVPTAPASAIGRC